MAKFATTVSGAMLLPSLIQITESISGSVVPLAMFESDQSELQSVVPTLYVVEICRNCILNAKKSKKRSNGQFHCFHYVR